MYRIVDLSFKPYAAPVGNGEALVKPSYRIKPELPHLLEPVSENRTVTDVLSYYEFNHIMSGVSAGEIFTKGTLTTKPFCTYATYLGPESNDPLTPRYIAELPSDYFAGPFVTADVSSSRSSGGEIDVEQLKAALPAPSRSKSDPAILVLRTGYGTSRPKKPDQKYLVESPRLSQAAAEALGACGYKTVVTDARSLDGGYGETRPSEIYRILGASGILLIEDAANLEQVGKGFDLIFVGVPLPIRGVTGGPARVFAAKSTQPTDFVDCSYDLDPYPDNPYDYDLPFIPPETKRGMDELGDYPTPIPGRIEPRESQGITQRTARLTPFNLISPDGTMFGEEMYIEYGHGTGTHIEAAFFDPWGRHAVPEELLRRYVRIPKDRLFGEACYLDLSNSVGPLQNIDAMHLKLADPGLKPGDIAVLRADITDWFFYGSTPGNTPGLSPDAASYLVEKKIRALVLDFAVEKSDPASGGIRMKYTSNKIHYLLHKNNIPIVEWSVNMKLLRKKRFLLAILAMSAAHQGGFPAHVIALENW